MATLYDIVGEYKELYLMLTDPEVDEQTVLDTLEGVTGELEVKAEGYVKVIRQIEAETKALEAEADFFKQKAATRKNNIKRMKEALVAALIATGHEDGLTAGGYTLKVAKNGGLAPLAITGDVPESFTKVVITPDGDKIREYLKDHSVEWAHLEGRGKHLTIK